jgi:hypothetical protein
MKRIGMSLKRWAARRDENEQAIVQALRQVGAVVAFLSDKGICDLLVLYHSRVFMLEVKRVKASGQAQGRATLAQEARTREGWPVTTVQTIDEALRAIGAIGSRRRQQRDQRTTT